MAYPVSAPVDFSAPGPVDLMLTNTTGTLVWTVATTVPEDLVVGTDATPDILHLYSTGEVEASTYRARTDLQLQSNSSAFYLSLKPSPLGFGATNHNIDIPVPTADDTVVLLATQQSLTNKTLEDASVMFHDNADPTKQARFELTNISPATTRVFTFPDSSTTIVGTNVTQTFNNKTITATTNTVTASQLRTTGADVVVSGAAPPTTGQVLTATSATTATWQTGATVTLTNAGAGATLVDDGTGPTLTVKSVSGTTNNIVLTSTATDINFDLMGIRINGNTTNTAAAGAVGAIAIGHNASGAGPQANGIQSVAIGSGQGAELGAEANGLRAVSIGTFSAADGDGSIALGYAAALGDYSISIGFDAYDMPTGFSDSIQIGRATHCSAIDTIAFGHDCNSTAAGATATGLSCTNTVANTWQFASNGDPTLKVSSPTTGGTGIWKVVRTDSTIGVGNTFTPSPAQLLGGLIIEATAGAFNVAMPTNAAMEAEAALADSLFVGAIFECMIVPIAGGGLPTIQVGGFSVMYGDATSSAGSIRHLRIWRNSGAPGSGTWIVLATY